MILYITNILGGTKIKNLENKSVAHRDLAPPLFETDFPSSFRRTTKTMTMMKTMMKKTKTMKMRTKKMTILTMMSFKIGFLYNIFA